MTLQRFGKQTAVQIKVVRLLHAGIYISGSFYVKYVEVCCATETREGQNLQPATLHLERRWAGGLLRSNTNVNWYFNPQLLNKSI